MAAHQAPPGILQARTLEWVAISFSNTWKWKVKVKLLSRVWLLATPWTAAYQDSSVHGIFQARVLEWVATFWVLQGPQSLLMGSPTLTRCVPWPGQFPLTGPADLHPVFNLLVSSNLPVQKLFKQVSHILLQEPRAPYPLVAAKPVSHSPCWFPVVSGVTPMWPGMVSSVLLQTMTVCDW